MDAGRTEVLLLSVSKPARRRPGFPRTLCPHYPCKLGGYAMAYRQL